MLTLEISSSVYGQKRNPPTNYKLNSITFSFGLVLNEVKVLENKYKYNSMYRKWHRKTIKNCSTLRKVNIGWICLRGVLDLAGSKSVFERT